jgi:hypothetical protein
VAGSEGGLDLWITRKEGERWGSPKNLGRQLNTAGNELFASLDRWNNLYFSSDGHSGKGGYDIFLARYNGSGWDRPIDLPGIINTKDDELAYTINKENNTAFFTSRSRSGKYRTQLYLVDVNKGGSQKSDITISERFLALAGMENATGPAGIPAPATNITQKKNEEATTTALVQALGNQETQKEAPPSSIPASTARSSEKKEDANTSPGPRTNVVSPEKKTAPATVTKPSPADQPSEIKMNEVIYRVQITASTKALGSRTIPVAGKNYKSFEYLYQGGYRTTIGEFSTLTEAMRLQSVCRQNGYSQAFVVAFKNNIRSNDPELFKKAP